MLLDFAFDLAVLDLLMVGRMLGKCYGSFDGLATLTKSVAERQFFG